MLCKGGSTGKSKSGAGEYRVGGGGVAGFERFVTR